jgi:hypothetical protein
MDFCMANTQSKEEREGKEEKNKKQFQAKPRRTTLHAPPIEEEDAEMN